MCHTFTREAVEEDDKYQAERMEIAQTMVECQPEDPAENPYGTRETIYGVREVPRAKDYYSLGELQPCTPLLKVNRPPTYSQCMRRCECGEYDHMIRDPQSQASAQKETVRSVPADLPYYYLFKDSDSTGVLPPDSASANNARPDVSSVSIQPKQDNLRRQAQMQFSQVQSCNNLDAACPKCVIEMKKYIEDPALILQNEYNENDENRNRDITENPYGRK